MLISCNWLKKYINFDLTPAQLDDTLTMLGVEVEACQNLAATYSGFIIGHVISKEKHPNADKLALCVVDVGKQTNIEQQTLQIVCGAPNVMPNQKVVVGQIGAIVPNGNFKLERRKIRKIDSEGMICSQTELNLGPDDGGIWVLPDSAPTGQTLADYMGLNDVILDISLTPNKADCASHIGIARELAAALKLPLHMPAVNLTESTEKTSDTLAVEVVSPELCPRYTARVIKNIQNGDSPDWLKSLLTKIGLKPRNIVVDVTNYILMELGQPLHAFDYDKVEAKKIIVKNGYSGQYITLDDKKRDISTETLMICDATKPLAIAGVMGGQNSEIERSTTSVILESATFNPTSIRKTAKKLGLSTDASYRYERGTDIDINIYAVDKAAEMIAQLAGGTVLNGIIDIYPEPRAPKSINFRYDYARKIIGSNVPNDEMNSIFGYLGFEVKPANDVAIITVPNRRVDIFGEIDLVEEIARLINYNNIAPDFASVVNFQRTEIPQNLKPLPLRDTIRKYLANNGFTELLTQNITDPASAALTNNDIITIENPLGGEMSAMRPDMLPSILKVISFNIKQGNSNLQLFETGKAFLQRGRGPSPAEMLSAFPLNVKSTETETFIDGIDERSQLMIAMCGSSAPRQWSVPDRKFDFFDIKGIVAQLLEHLHIKKINFNAVKNIGLKLFGANSAEIIANKQPIGVIGEIDATILKHYDIDTPVIAASIDLTALNNIDIPPPYYSPTSPYPAMKRDLAFTCENQYSVNEIKTNIVNNTSSLLRSVAVFDVYTGKNIDIDKRSIGFELTFSSMERTLTDAEVDSEINTVIKSVETTFKAELRK